MPPTQTAPGTWARHLGGCELGRQEMKKGQGVRMREMRTDGERCGVRVCQSFLIYNIGVRGSAHTGLN